MSKLAEAKALIQERGRTNKGLLEDSDGCLCPLGALNMAYTGESGEYSDSVSLAGAYTPSSVDQVDDINRLAKVARARELSPYIGADRGQPYYCYVYQYNDRGATTDEDIYSLFDEAMAL